MIVAKPNVINDRRAVASLGRKKGSLSISSYPLNLSRSPSPRYRGHFFSPGRRSKEDQSPDLVGDELARKKCDVPRGACVRNFSQKGTPVSASWATGATGLATSFSKQQHETRCVDFCPSSKHSILSERREAVKSSRAFSS